MIMESPMEIIVFPRKSYKFPYEQDLQAATAARTLSGKVHTKPTQAL